MKRARVSRKGAAEWSYDLGLAETGFALVVQDSPARLRREAAEHQRLVDKAAADAARRQLDLFAGGR